MIMATFLVMVVLSFSSITVKAAGTVKELAINSTITDKSGENVWYSFKTPDRGYFTINLGKADITQDSYWTVELYNESQNVITYWRGDKISTEKMSSLPNKTLYIKVSPGYRCEEVLYNLSVTTTADATWELEYNDDEARANPLAMNTDMYGMSSYSDDPDFYKVVVPNQAGYFVASLGHTDISQTNSWKMEIVTSDGKRVWYGEGSSIVSGTINFKPGTVLFVKITPGYQTEFQPYKLRVDFTSNGYFELEKNDTQAEATPISFGTEYTGLIDGHEGEVDWYSFKVTGNSAVTIDFGPKDLSGDGSWAVYLINSTDNEKRLAYTTTRESIKVNLKPGTYYIKMCNGYGSEWRLYTLKVSSKALSKVKTPKIKKVLIKKYMYSNGLASVKMSKGIKTDADYEVKVAAKKNMKKLLLTTTADAGKVMKTFASTSLSKKKVYYVQVRPFVVDIFGDKVYVGAKSNVYKAKAKK